MLSDKWRTLGDRHEERSGGIVIVWARCDPGDMRMVFVRMHREGVLAPSKTLRILNFQTGLWEVDGSWATGIFRSEEEAIEKAVEWVRLADATDRLCGND